MSEGRAGRLERILEKTARAVSGGSLHPAELLQRVQAAALASVRDSTIANQYRITLNEADYRRYQPAVGELRGEVERLLEAIERRHRYTRIGDRLVTFESSSRVPVGMPEVEALFADTSHPVPAAQVRLETQRIQRHGGVILVLGDGTRVRVTHTPFTIGRAPGNDLVLPDMAISRSHARIVRSAEGFEIEDAGSRNGIVQDGIRMARASLEGGRSVLLGDIVMRLERPE